MTHLQCSGGGKDVGTQDCTLHVFLDPFVDDVKLCYALAKQTPSKHKFTTFVHDGGCYRPHSISSKHFEFCSYQTA